MRALKTAWKLINYMSTALSKVKESVKNLLSEIRKGYGEKFWLHTWVHNKSIGFYKKYGFQDIGSYLFTLGEEKIENRVLRYSST